MYAEARNANVDLCGMYVLNKVDGAGTLLY